MSRQKKLAEAIRMAGGRSTKDGDYLGWERANKVSKFLLDHIPSYYVDHIIHKRDLEELNTAQRMLGGNIVNRLPYHLAFAKETKEGFMSFSLYYNPAMNNHRWSLHTLLNKHIYFFNSLPEVSNFFSTEDGKTKLQEAQCRLGGEIKTFTRCGLHFSRRVQYGNVKFSLYYNTGEKYPWKLYIKGPNQTQATPFFSLEGVIAAVKVFSLTEPVPCRTPLPKGCPFLSDCKMDDIPHCPH
ncbi:hypothetical protein LCGC14_1721320 [marine sediment metagenome]|uniref:Uncharacterized protein n=1 Tax=marine sediment metagenome TaxID=412755 RepID=A0A0F9KC15_9ZZZZ